MNKRVFSYLVDATPRLLRIALPAALAVLTCSLNAYADTIGGVNFGSAGPSNWGILALGGSKAAGFGSSGTQVSFNGPGAGVYGTAFQSNLGIAGTGHLNSSGTTTIDGAYYKGSSTGGDAISGTTIVGGIQTGAAVNAKLAQAAADAAAGLAAANALACNMGALCNTALNPGSSLTINPTNPGGQNVLVLSSITIGNGIKVTLGGPAGTTWVIKDKGDLTLNSGTLTVGNGLNPSSLLLIVDGKVATSGGLNHESVITGVVVVPTGTAQFSPGAVNGEVIVGGTQVSFVSGGSLTVPTVPPVPEPGTLSLLGTGLLAGATLLRRKLPRS